MARQLAWNPRSAWSASSATPVLDGVFQAYVFYT